VCRLSGKRRECPASGALQPPIEPPILGAAKDPLDLVHPLLIGGSSHASDRGFLAPVPCFSLPCQRAPPLGERTLSKKSVTCLRHLYEASKGLRTGSWQV
jgi:hypothetical protein